MRKKETYIFLSLLAAVGILIRMSFGGFNQNVYGEHMVTSTPRIERLFSKTKSLCLGRFLLDVPENAIVAYGPSETPWPITTYVQKASEAESIVAARLDEIENEKRFASGPLRSKETLVGRVIDGVVPGQKIVFGVSGGGTSIYRIDSYIPVNDDLFVQRASAIPVDKDEVIQNLNAVAIALRSRTASEIPSAPGVCIEDGFVIETDALSYEAVNLGVRLAEFPDVHFSVSMTKKDEFVESDALEPRLRQAEEIARREGHAAWYARIKTLRRGYRSLGKWRGFEILARKPAQAAEEEAHELAFLSQGEPNNPYLPVLDLELHSGVQDNQIGGVRPSVTDDEVIEIWDRIIASIRVRPTQKN